MSDIGVARPQGDKPSGNFLRPSARYFEIKGLKPAVVMHCILREGHRERHAHIIASLRRTSRRRYNLYRLFQSE